MIRDKGFVTDLAVFYRLQNILCTCLVIVTVVIMIILASVNVSSIISQTLV